MLAGWCAGLLLRFGRKSGATTVDFGRKPEWWPAPRPVMRWTARGDGVPEAVWVDDGDRDILDWGFGRLMGFGRGPIWIDESELEDMGVYRCPTCLTNWPTTAQYARCPECGEQCHSVWNDNPIDGEEARSRLLHAKFEAFYAERAKRQANEAAELVDRALA